MSPRNFDIAIALKPDAVVQSYYSDHLYRGSDFFQKEHMAVLEGKHYVFRFGGVAYGVAPDGVEFLKPITEKNDTA